MKSAVWVRFAGAAVAFVVMAVLHALFFRRVKRRPLSELLRLEYGVAREQVWYQKVRQSQQEAGLKHDIFNTYQDELYALDGAERARAERLAADPDQLIRFIVERRQ